MFRWRAVSSCVLATVLAALGASGSAAAHGSHHAPDSLRAPLTRERFYFVMPDRFANGDTANDRGGLSGPREVTGFDATHKGWYHGGDLKGLISKLDYIKGLGTTAIWLTAPRHQRGPAEADRRRAPARDEGLLRHHHQPHR